jgi:antitoxin (DNA-binding transcriptional repressor) of toxin-antitoxin stability system
VGRVPRLTRLCVESLGDLVVLAGSPVARAIGATLRQIVEARDKASAGACYALGMAAVTVAEALTRLADLISEAARRTVVIVAGDRAVRLTPVRPPQHHSRRFGSAAGRVHMAKDFDEPLTDFVEHS